ncbi:MAG: hypothetical protein ABEJ89_09390 [Haloarculaceae archaeon]
MPCPHAGGSQDDPRSGPSDDALSRRQMIRAAVAIGGTSALSACLDRERDGTATPTERSFPQGPDDLSTLPERQHAWTDYLVRDRFGNTVLPQHHAILLLRYTGPEPPTQSDRESVESAFRTLERAYQRGTGGEPSVVQNEGLLFVVGYAPRYFDRFDAALPASVDLPPSDELLGTIGESEPTADDYDAAVHLASDRGSVLLAVEQALFGELETLNGVSVAGSLDPVFEVAERRTGFVGRDQPAQRYENDDIPDSAPLSMGFKSAYRDTLPSEDRITIRDGPFAGGTTMQVSRLEHDLEAWYDHDHGERTRRMFSPEHTSEDVGEVGEDLASSSGITEAIAERAERDAREEGVLGHGQKIARARDEEFNQRILRRDFDIADTPGLHFDAWQRTMDDFVQVRRAMNGDGIDAEVDEADDGILSVITVTNRATYLMPPRSLRALPRPRP